MAKTASFGKLQVPIPGFGAMGLSFGLGNNLSLEQAEPVLLKAIELGCTFWDTAVVYGAGINEKLLGDFIRKHNVRDKVFIASKCGFNCLNGGDGSVTNSAAHIKEYIEGTIERLGFTPDLYYLHRIEPGRSLEESIGALDEIRKAGKTKYIGLSECSAETLRNANAIAKIDAVQAEYSAFETLHETDTLIDTARELDIAYVAYSPLGHGWLVDDFAYNSPNDFAADDFRRKCECTPWKVRILQDSRLIFRQHPNFKAKTFTQTKPSLRRSRNLHGVRIAHFRKLRSLGSLLRA